MAHTPGPWIVKTGKHGWPRGIDAPADMQTKGGVGSVVRWNGIGFPSSPTAAANARLIAAAPEMLAALEAVESEYALGGLVQEIVAAAIAKATGQQG